MVKKIRIVSLSRGILGEPFVKHELDIGLDRLAKLGIEVEFSSVALKGIDYVAKHPDLRAKDLLDAFKSDADMILCAVGGDDTYRLLPYLFDNDELKKAISDKIFLGFSDTTINHFMLYKAGLNTFYGQAFLPDVCELDKEMLPYTRHYFEELIQTGTIKEIVPSDVWYSSRTDFSLNAVGTSNEEHKNNGFELLCGSPVFKGEILGGCIDSIHDIFSNNRYEDTVSKCQAYQLFPSLDDWKGKILLLESSEETPTPELYRQMIRELKSTGMFEVINGVLIGKPQNEIYFDEYKKVLIEELGSFNLSIVININIGHALPRCIIPFGVKATVDVNKQKITFETKASNVR